MGEKTGISWTDHTWNPWMGCNKVSQGCKNCYMFREQDRYGTDPKEIRKSKTTFSAPMGWTEAAKVFVCSWSDFFHEAVPMTWRDDAWEIIRATPWLTYQILTKRPQNMASRLPSDWGNGYPNVWLGVSCENQEVANERIPWLLHFPAKVHFLSCEPLLGRVDIGLAIPCGYYCDEVVGHVDHHFWTPGIDPGIDWVIAGGESGSGCRLPLAEWFLDLRDQCAAVKVPFFFKQWGGARKFDGVWGGDILDGKQYHEFPEEVTAT